MVCDLLVFVVCLCLCVFVCLKCLCVLFEIDRADLYGVFIVCGVVVFFLVCAV